MGLIRGILIAVAISFAGGVSAQVPSEPEPILVVNTERLFAESQFGQDIRADLDQQRLALQAENERIVEQLVAEEQDLAARRPDMPVEDFRQEAEAFDRKAVEIRAARDAKDREITAASNEAQSRFNDQVREIVGQVMLDRGGNVVLDSRSVYIALRSVDITEDVIVRLDAAWEASANQE